MAWKRANVANKKMNDNLIRDLYHHQIKHPRTIPYYADQGGDWVAQKASRTRKYCVPVKVPKKYTEIIRKKMNQTPFEKAKMAKRLRERLTRIELQKRFNSDVKKVRHGRMDMDVLQGRSVECVRF